MNPTSFRPEIVKVSFDTCRDLIGELRIRAWKNEYGIDRAFFAQEKWIDEIDDHPDVHHWIAVSGERIAAAGRLSVHRFIDDVPYADFLDSKTLASLGAPPIASINRLVVDPDFRGLGLARRLDSERIQFAGNGLASVITAQPMEERVHALTMLGFEMITRIHSPFQIPGRRIYFMIKKLHEHDR